MKYRYRLIPSILFGLLLALCAEGLLAWWAARCGYEDDGRAMACEIILTQDCEASGGLVFAAGGGTPQVSFVTERPMGSVRLHFAEPLAADTQVVLYYAPDTGTSFDPLRRAERYMMAGTDEGQIALPAGDWRYARLDIGSGFSVAVEPIEALAPGSIAPARIAACVQPRRLAVTAVFGVAGCWILLGSVKRRRRHFDAEPNHLQTAKGQAAPSAKPQASPSRVPFYDALRVLAALLVIVLHVTSSLQVMDPSGMGRHLAAITVKHFSMACNCLFFLLSGALLLPYREEPAGTFFRKRFLTAALPLVVCSFFYVRLLCCSQVGGGALFAYWLRMFVTRQIPLAPHLRLVYEIIAAYLLVIPFRYMLKEMPERAQKGLCLLTLVMLALRTAALAAGQPMGISVFLNEWPGVLLLGYFLTRDWMRPYDGLLLFAGIAALAATVAVSGRPGYEDVVANHSIFMVLTATAIFAACLQMNRFFKPMGGLLAFLGRYSYLVILIHWYVLYGLLFCSRLSVTMPSQALWVIQLSFCTALSFAAAMVMEHFILAPLEAAAGGIAGRMHQSNGGVL